LTSLFFIYFCSLFTAFKSLLNKDSVFSIERKYIQTAFHFLWFMALSGIQLLPAQMSDRMYISDNQIDTLKKGQLSVDIDNLTFFKNNEYNSTAQKGYTLPGFWLQAKAVYYPLSTIKLEAGVHSIWFWGATMYPAFAYKEIATWKGKDYAHHVHALPFFRVHLALTDRMSLILGNLYGAANHRLIEPLYNPELNLTSDPETGLQFLYHGKRLQLDLWLDWMTYIYKLDTQQEAFVTGGSAFFNVTDPASSCHVYLPMQGLALHRGGEIEMTDGTVQTLINGALGAGVKWNRNGRVMKNFKTEYAFTGFYFPKGRTYQPEYGFGHFIKSAVQLNDFNISASYWLCNDFVPIFGNVFYSSISAKKDRMLYKNPSLLNIRADYVRSFGKGFALGVKADVYRYMSGKMYSADTRLFQPQNFGKNTNYSLEIVFRMTPSFQLSIFN